MLVVLIVKIPFCLVLVPPAPEKKFCAELLPPPFGAKREESRNGFYPNRGKRAAIDCRDLVKIATKQPLIYRLSGIFCEKSRNRTYA